MTNWKPISTAPKRKGKAILVGWWDSFGCDMRPVFVQATSKWIPAAYALDVHGGARELLRDGRWELAWQGYRASFSDVNPTHWQPLPAPPKREKSAK